MSCDRLGKWIFVNLDPDAENLRDYLGIVADHMEQFQPGNLRHVHSKTYPVESNVKVLLDAFLEVYHVPSIHQKTVTDLLILRVQQLIYGRMATQEWLLLTEEMIGRIRELQD